MRRSPLLVVVVLGCAPGPVPPRVVIGPPVPRTSCTGTASTDSAVYDAAQVTERPVVYDGPILNYPPELRAAGVQGRVLLSVVINTDGRADAGSIEAIRSPDFGLTYEARRWVVGAKFWPGCLTGRPVRVRVAIPIDFKVMR